MPATPALPLADPHFKPPAAAPTTLDLSWRQKLGLKKDQLKNLKIETELRRDVRENIAHHRMIGSYVGRRHVMGLPVRGQNTRTNAKTAKELNKVERRG